ncbi:MAG: aspartate carbamoyltransferase catalytic subunit [Dissulfurimicrobium sp.]|uniref:aspartate carbamoyltransferase catalytic subunit n=1 Tax=Dissulfurimicrobium TaxID=1769732 RepID=UPI001EDAC3FC|nr:aspartate carbamoyltransferase catalytic subunit [Dissulfurimicrobium hydrothermale]UKL14502.1 aspartate carbamoyltransferase catalytic subunit [Dissulfurimicrobium hydrothermale]
MNRLSSRHILSISDLGQKDIELILDTADSLSQILTRPIKKAPPLRGRTIVNLFFEPSTRTRLSFELAAKRLSADTVSVSAAASSVVKGETLIDTAKNIEAMRPDVVVLRHPCSGASHLMARYMERAAVINAGDGMNEHPTQALLDLFTVKRHLGRLSGLKVAIIGDIAHSRVAHSDIRAFAKMGADVFVSGPATMFPSQVEALGATVVLRPEDAIKEADVVMALRIQKERQGRSLIPGVREYASVYGLTSERLKLARPGAIVMHPGPVNRGVEIAPQVQDGPFSVILDQVTNGVAVRMAILSLILPETV